MFEIIKKLKPYLIKMHHLIINVFYSKKSAEKTPKKRRKNAEKTPKKRRKNSGKNNVRQYGAFLLRSLHMDSFWRLRMDSLWRVPYGVYLEAYYGGKNINFFYFHSYYFF